mgnify:CR=1 FL=1
MIARLPNHLHEHQQRRDAGRYKPPSSTKGFFKIHGTTNKKDLQKNCSDELVQFEVKAKDRQYQFWERNSLSVELRTGKVFQQKLHYIHFNPVKAGLCNLPEEYRYSSASFYEWNKTEWEFLTHHKD